MQSSYAKLKTPKMLSIRDIAKMFDKSNHNHSQEVCKLCLGLPDLRELLSAIISTAALRESNEAVKGATGRNVKPGKQYAKFTPEQHMAIGKYPQYTECDIPSPLFLQKKSPLLHKGHAKIKATK